MLRLNCGITLLKTLMLKALLVDDEPPARQRLKKLLRPLEGEGRVRVDGEVGDGVKALEKLRATEIDVLFLDIRMPEWSGFDLLQRLDPDERPAVIFVTAYDEYALQAFEENAADYLLKPIDRDRLREAVARVEEAQGPSEERLEQLLDWVEEHGPGTDDGSEQEESEHPHQITVPHRDRILVKSTDDLVMAEIKEGIVRLFFLETADGGGEQLRQYMVDYTLDQLESNLDADRFARVHRSTIVQVSHIREMISWFSGRYKLVLTTGREVIASRQRSKKLKERLMLS